MIGTPGRAETAPRRPESDRERLALLTHAIAELSQAGTREGVIEAVRRAALQLSGASGISIVVREDELCHYIAEDSAFPLWTGQRFPLGACISGHAMLTGQQVVIPDIYVDDRIPHDAYRPTPIKSLVMTPVGRPTPHTALGAYWDACDAPEPFDAAIMEALAASMATALENLDLVASLQDHARRAQALYADSQAELRAREAAQKRIGFQAHLLDMVQSAVIATDLQGRVTFWNRAAETLYGWTEREALGSSILQLNAASESYAEAAGVLKTLETGETWQGDIVLRRKDGSTFCARVVDSPILDGDGALMGIVGVSWDITAERAADKRQELLLHELSHRVKNTLTIIQSIARQSFRSEEGLEEARRKFEGRIQTLAAAHTLLTQSGWRSILVRDLVDQSLQPFLGDSASQRLTLAGPDLRLGSSQAVALALALHELATNAVKYGALSAPEGRVEVRWWLTRGLADARLQMQWREVGGPKVRPPGERGFGSRLLERGLAMELAGSVQMRFEPDGLVCLIDAPAPYDDAFDEPEQGQLVFPHLV
jgi:PAS domain S-box-containing protein